MRVITVNRPPAQKHRQAGIIYQAFLSGIVLCLVLGAITAGWLLLVHRASDIPEVRSGIAGYCLDDYHNRKASKALVDAWKCNGTPAQDWVVSGSNIKHGNNGCLDILANGQTAGDKVVTSPCNGAAGQAWTADFGGFENPASGLCLSLPGNQTKVQLIAASCNNLTSRSEAWSADTWSSVNYLNISCGGTEGQKVACYARKQWALWQSGDISHRTLLNEYSDGNGYEEWCADFVSYIYKQAGYPFTQGERDGWDEYLASNIQNMGFTIHSAEGYDPQPGDIAFFNYSDGHVEIVVNGGQRPAFIYGDSSTVDPATGNGEMNESTLTSDGAAGHVIYYLSPN